MFGYSQQALSQFEPESVYGGISMVAISSLPSLLKDKNLEIQPSVSQQFWASLYTLPTNRSRRHVRPLLLVYRTRFLAIGFVNLKVKVPGIPYSNSTHKSTIASCPGKPTEHKCPRHYSGPIGATPSLSRRTSKFVTGSLFLRQRQGE